MIRLSNYSVTRGGFTLSIQDVELEGKRNFVIGKNGAGKTTLLQSLAGLVESSGEFELNGRNIGSLEPQKRNIGYIPQDLLLFGTMTVDGNLLSSIRYGNGDIDVYREVSDRMGLTPLLQKRTNEISLGQAQRVAIARAIISRPSVLLMDEPFSFQDEISRLGLISLIDEFSKTYDFDYIYATHNAKDMEIGFSSLVSIDEGQVVEVVDSVSKIQHYRTLSLLDYKNLASLNGRYYLLTEESLDFNDVSGIPYEIVGTDEDPYVRFNIEGSYYFAYVRSIQKARYLRVMTDKAKELVF
ncbi:MAG: ATP-binding cassette domain-containing protein [Thermoplasmata archaeon]